MVKRTYLHLSVITVITAVLWMMISIYHSLTSPTDINIDSDVKAPFSANLDQEVLNMILAREDLSNLNFAPPISTKSANTINEITPATTEEPNNSATPSATPE